MEDAEIQGVRHCRGELNLAPLLENTFLTPDTMKGALARHVASGLVFQDMIGEGFQAFLSQAICTDPAILNLVAASRVDFNNRPHSSLAGVTSRKYTNQSKRDQSLNRANP